MGILNKDEQLKVTCESKFKICSYNSEICKEYEGAFEKALEGQLKVLENDEGHCDILGLGSLKKAGELSTQFINEAVFSKKDCSDKNQANFQSLKLKLDIFRSNISLPVKNENNYINQCIYFPNLPSKQDGISKVEDDLKKLSDLILERTANSEKLKELLCLSNIESLYDSSGKLKMNNLMCLVVEDARLSVPKKEDYALQCIRSIKVEKKRVEEGDSKRASDLDNTRPEVALDLSPVAQQPMPKIVSDATEAPIGLQPALATIDSMAPNGYSAGASSEGNIGTGAVRNYGVAPDFASRAGQVITPVINKFRAMADSAVNAAPSKRGTLARSLAGGTVAGAKIGANLGTQTKLPDGSVRTVSALSVSSNSTGSELQLDASEPGADAAMASTAGGAGSRISARGEVVGGSNSGPVRNSRLPSGDQSSGSPSSGSSAGSTDSGSLTPGYSATDLQKRIFKLSKPEDVRKFFTQEASKYPQFRNMLYAEGSNPVKDKLEELCVKVVSKKNKTSTQKVFKTTNIISDTGSTFIPIKIGKCEK
ncbi:MAG: hypothetical protein JNL11_03100 [Bdellovibrionaceae bacterium]|nr:hypothetical protein [Pseudobdellovibrionaceae bacterium]